MVQKMKLKSSYQIIAIVILVAVGLLLGFLFTRDFYFARQQSAIQSAIEACNPAYGLQPVEQPTESQAHLAIYRGSLVWIVDMKGKWILVGGPQPDPTGNFEPSYWDECTIIIDVLTEDVLSTPIE